MQYRVVSCSYYNHRIVTMLVRRCGHVIHKECIICMTFIMKPATLTRVMYWFYYNLMRYNLTYIMVAKIANTSSRKLQQLGFREIDHPSLCTLSTCLPSLYPPPPPSHRSFPTHTASPPSHLFPIGNMQCGNNNISINSYNIMSEVLNINLQHRNYPTFFMVFFLGGANLSRLWQALMAGPVISYFSLRSSVVHVNTFSNLMNIW